MMNLGDPLILKTKVGGRRVHLASKKPYGPEKGGGHIWPQKTVKLVKLMKMTNLVFMSPIEPLSNTPSRMLATTKLGWSTTYQKKTVSSMLLCFEIVFGLLVRNDRTTHF